MSDTRVTVKQAAKELNMGTLTVQYLMREGRLPIGYALKKDGKSRWMYIIYRGDLDKCKKEHGII